MRALIWRDIYLALRTGGGAGLALGFFLMSISLTAFGIGPNPDLLSRVAPGAIWVSAVLATLLSLDRLFALDFEDGSLEALFTSPMPLETVVLAKACAHWLSTGLPLAIAAPVLGILLNLDLALAGLVFISLLVGTPALSLIGAFASALSVGVKRGGLLLSLLVLPLYVPSLMLGGAIIRAGALGQDISAMLAILAAISAGSLAAMPFAAGHALRVNLR